MSWSRSQMREKSMIVLYQLDIYHSAKVFINDSDLIEANLAPEAKFGRELVNGVLTNQVNLDQTANKYLKNWNINRLDKIGAALLRMGIYELQVMDTPPLVVINEALDLAHRYCDESVRKMINAVLDKVKLELEMKES